MLNHVQLIGNLGADPEIRVMPNGDKVTTLSVATTRRWKDKQSGERKEETEWHRVTIFGKLAEIAGEYLKKGSKCYLEGRIKTSKYQKDGVDHYSTGIIADQMIMLDTRGEHQSNDQSYPSQSQATAQGKNSAPYDDDIPF